MLQTFQNPCVQEADTVVGMGHFISVEEAKAGHILRPPGKDMYPVVHFRPRDNNEDMADLFDDAVTMPCFEVSDLSGLFDDDTLELHEPEPVQRMPSSADISVVSLRNREAATPDMIIDSEELSAVMNYGAASTKPGSAPPESTERPLLEKDLKFILMCTLLFSLGSQYILHSLGLVNL